VVESNLATRVAGPSSGQTEAAGVPEQQSIFHTAREHEAAKVTLRVLKEFERLPRSADLQKPRFSSRSSRGWPPSCSRSKVSWVGRGTG